MTTADSSSGAQGANMLLLVSRFSRNPTLVVGIALCVPLAVVAVAGALFAPFSFSAMHASDTFAPPFQSPYLFGTDHFGRDVLSRVIYGARYSILIALLASFIATAVGTLLGLLAGYSSGLLSNVILRLTDLVLAFPGLLLAIVIVAMVGPGLMNAAVALGVVYTPRLIRVMRSEVLNLRERDYVSAAVALGSGHGRILLRHILVNAFPIVVVYMSILFSYALLAEAALSFLGLGVQPPYPSWGGMLREGRSYLNLAPTLSVFPGIAILYSVFSVNLLSDGLSEALDPRLRHT